MKEKKRNLKTQLTNSPQPPFSALEKKGGRENVTKKGGRGDMKKGGRGNVTKKEGGGILKNGGIENLKN